MKRSRKPKKWQLATAIGLASLVVVGAGGILLFRNPSQSSAVEEVSQVVVAKEGSLASSVLLSGIVTAKEEQYVYLDASKGDLDEILVNVGDQVSQGQALVKYKSAEAQASYDAAKRAVSKADRHISELNETRNSILSTPLAPPSQTAEAGEVPAQAQVNSGQSVASVDAQISDAYDTRADAVDQMNKAQAILDALTVLSTVEGTVVEVNKDQAKTANGTTSVLVHIASNENLQVKGELSEYNLANLSVGQEVSFTSKVYPDKTWTGTLSYISDYPKNQGSAHTHELGSTAGSKYPYTVDVTSEIGDLKQGFSVSVEIKNKNTAILLPLTSVVTRDEKSYVWVVDEQNRAKQVEVTLGNADATNQEVRSGITSGAKVISNPTDSLEEGKEVMTDETTH